MQTRIIGIDLAQALGVIEMIIVNFKLIFGIQGGITSSPMVILGGNYCTL